MTSYPQIPTTVKARYKFLKKELKRFQGRRYYCNALKAMVWVTGNSINETTHWASRSQLSTKLALRMPYVIQNATLYKDNVKPKNNHQITRFHFIKLALLRYGVRGLGTALLTVGYRDDGERIEYCVTDFKAKNR